MGMFGHVSSGSYPPDKQIVYVTGNPNPKNFYVHKYQNENPYLIVLIEYPDCINFEGKKILVFKDVTMKKLLKQKFIDPHFTDKKEFCAPIARFIPTMEGWNYAVSFVKSLKEK